MPYTQQGIPFKTGAGAHTSHKAAASIDIRKRGAKTKLYLRILSTGPATDHEMARDLHVPVQSITSIRNNLLQVGLVEKRCEIKVGPYGKDCATWGLTAAGVAAVKELEAA